MALSNVSEQVTNLNRSLSESQKVRGGSVLLLAGTAFIALLAFFPLGTALQVLIGLIGTLLIVLGTLSIGTSGIQGRAV
jgi:hypothetical protein